MARKQTLILVCLFSVVSPLSWAAWCFEMPTSSFPKGFHNGGIASCDVCHVKKVQPIFSTTSSAAAVVPGTELQQGLLNGMDPSSICLRCHSAPVGQRQPFGIFIATSKEDLAAGLSPVQLTPAGDFGWLLKTFKWSSKGNNVNDESSPGDSHGHNIVARDYGFNPDMTNALAPGGTYPADRLSCSSCHDPHGTYRRSANGSVSLNGLPIKSSGSYSTSPNPDSAGTVGTYRMLAGAGYQPAALKGDFAFTADPPAALSPPDYNRAETRFDTRVAYGSGMSEWCRNCHVTTHKDAHPMGNTGLLTTEVIRIYNGYRGSGSTTGSKDSAFNSLVPYEMGTRDYDILSVIANSNGSDRSGPKNGSTVMCLSCHRAHASGWDHMTRWNVRSGMIVDQGAFVGSDSKSAMSVAAAQGRLAAETARAYYDRTSDAFVSKQRSMCSKCHAKD
ncbi:cytochrome C [Geomonas agri]|uniref:cytochrome C n=1 Tax=Geomonas agri TaxID=2873702 RepID=UPI001CD264C9|nr:cytochrome C [Geomonas agri]